jgi:hypothetical protein
MTDEHQHHDDPTFPAEPAPAEQLPPLLQGSST